MEKKTRRYTTGDVEGILVYSPHGTRSRHYGRDCHQYNYILSIRTISSAKLLTTKSVQNPSITGIKELLGEWGRKVAQVDRQPSGAYHVAQRIRSRDAHMHTRSIHDRR